ncbi:tyrosine-type recombinase/integrase [Rhodopirellula bahusiensis]|uniref:tyrosine-type recombinase/integrase n=1 Tax=Rhodopirellula bahusiensis TaxID=2014065 RepID=UPI001304070C|nr:site-specific integrase [Rhodopirellula bahusiensis]
MRNGDISEKTVEDYRWYINRFSTYYGKSLSLNIEPRHVSDWLDAESTWGNSAQRGAITAIKRLYSWAFKERRITDNPLAGIEKPSANRRSRLIDAETHSRMILRVRHGGYACPSDKQFQLVLVAMKHSGGRPQDIANARVEYVKEDYSRWELPKHKRYRHTLKPKLVYLSPCLRTVTMILKAGRSKGPLFQGRRGPLTVNAIGCRIKRLTEQLKIPPGLIAYTYRHTFITESLQRGVDVATVAVLAGTSIQMIERHYSHIYQDHERLVREVAVCVGSKSVLPADSK